MNASTYLVRTDLHYELKNQIYPVPILFLPFNVTIDSESYFQPAERVEDDSMQEVSLGIVQV